MDILQKSIYCFNPKIAPLSNYRNYKQRQKIWDKIESLTNDFNNMTDSLSDIEFNNLSNTVYQNHHEEIAKLYFEFKVLVYPVTKNEWFYNFIKSFEISKEIKLSPNQINIFQKYGENIEYYKNEYCGSCNEYFFELNNRYVKIYKLA